MNAILKRSTPSLWLKATKDSHGIFATARRTLSDPKQHHDTSKTLNLLANKIGPMPSKINLKVEEKDNNETYVYAEPISTGEDRPLVKKESKACVLCRLNLHNLQYTDVLILSQFVKSDGSVDTFQESRLCSKQHSKVVRLVKQAQRCNLITRPPDYLVPGPWHDLNTYIEPDRKRDQPMKIIKKQYWKI